MKDVVILLRATSSEAQKFSTDIFFYEKRIAEITPLTQILIDPVKTYNPISVSELKITAASVSVEFSNVFWFYFKYKREKNFSKME